MGFNGIVINNSKLPKLFNRLLKQEINGLTIWPFIFLEADIYQVSIQTINHERIHIKQMNETLVFGFYLILAYDWTIGLIKYRDSKKTYEHVRFEQEAYQHESHLNYFQTRKHFAWWGKKL